MGCNCSVPPTSRIKLTGDFLPYRMVSVDNIAKEIFDSVFTEGERLGEFATVGHLLPG